MFHLCPICVLFVSYLCPTSAKLPPLSGERIEGDGLEMGVFTQDLAQDLDQTATAVEVVARNVRARDATVRSRG